jgi:hypothetical protein
VSHPRVAEAAVVGKPHDIKGESVFAYVVCRGARPAGNVAALVDELRKWVSEQLGAIARPDDIRFADNLPKTRSGKIMRRLLRSIARGEEISQDVSTLENPGILDQLRGVDAGTAADAGMAKGSGARAAAKPGKKPATRKPAAATRGAKRPGAKAPARRKSKAAAKSAAKKGVVAKRKPARRKIAKPAHRKIAKPARRKAASTRSARNPARSKVTRGGLARGKPAKRAAAGKPR